MTLADADEITRPIGAQRNPTLDLADELIGAERSKCAREEAQAAVAPDYRVAAYELERLAICLKAYSRGMVSKDALPGYFEQAREAINAMERAPK